MSELTVCALRHIEKGGDLRGRDGGSSPKSFPAQDFAGQRLYNRYERAVWGGEKCYRSM
jgi:hypothetical protein